MGERACWCMLCCTICTQVRSNPCAGLADNWCHMRGSNIRMFKHVLLSCVVFCRRWSTCTERSRQRNVPWRVYVCQQPLSLSSETLGKEGICPHLPGVHALSYLRKLESMQIVWWCGACIFPFLFLLTCICWHPHWCAVMFTQLACNIQ